MLYLFLIMKLPVAALSQTSEKPYKIKHAEPLYIDLMRDLGAHRGEKEINVGMSYQEMGEYNTVQGFAEYEFAVADRLGLEVEMPFSLYNTPDVAMDASAMPHSKVEGLKLAGQYTFLVSKRAQTSMAIAFIHEFRFHSAYSVRQGKDFFYANSENPIFVAAKRWGRHVHTLLYTGPEWVFSAEPGARQFVYQLNYSLHYMVEGNHFVGMEVNQEWTPHGWETVLHPQVKVALSHRVALGLVTGLATGHHGGSPQLMTRLIVEP